jgi:hypothetical protein
VPDVIGRFRAYHERPENGAWGSLHLVLEDHNIADSNVEFCIRWAAGNGDVEGEALARILLAMSKTQRLKIASMA